MIDDDDVRQMKKILKMKWWISWNLDIGTGPRNNSQFNSLNIYPDQYIQPKNKRKKERKRKHK
jgi:hypothetical protein